jgi:hypothetical protein
VQKVLFLCPAIHSKVVCERFQRLSGPRLQVLIGGEMCEVSHSVVKGKTLKIGVCPLRACDSASFVKQICDYWVKTQDHTAHAYRNKLSLIKVSI